MAQRDDRMGSMETAKAAQAAKANGGAKVPDRELTERTLERCALALLERDGVLSGLNLREVADEAGVNRGLVYHYYGSRQQLLRAALRRDIKTRLADIMGISEPRLVKRMAARFRAIVRHREAIKLLALLVLDGDSHVRMVYAKDLTLPEIAEGMASGEIPDDVSPEALLAAANALYFGYALFRQRYAAELKVPVTKLDAEVERASLRLIFGTPDGWSGPARSSS